VPAFLDGQPQGFKLFAIRPGSLFALLGLRNGDLVRGFNGFELSSLDKALQAYSMLRSRDEVKLDLERAGARLVLTYVLKK
jgi:general secretion pathway protein C